MTSRIRHVDIISSDPLAGTEQILARVWMNGGPALELMMSADANGADADLMWSYLESRVDIDPKEDPSAFLDALPQAIDATYVFASPVHEADECSFPDALPVAVHARPTSIAP
jgi:hypothetical protein